MDFPPATTGAMVDEFPPGTSFDRSLADDRMCGRPLPWPVVNDGHVHPHLEFNLVAGGNVTYQIGGRRWRLGPDRLSALWGALPHAVVAQDPGIVLVWFTVPLGWALRLPGFAPALDRLMAGELLVDRDPQPMDEAIARRWLADLSHDSPQSIPILQREAEARLLRLSSGRGGRALAAHGDAVATMAAWLQEHFREDRPLGEAARAAGIHPHTGAKLCRQALGTTLAAYRTNLRLAHAHRLLGSTERTVLDIALESGFGSSTRFYAAYADAYGHPPRGRG